MSADVKNPAKTVNKGGRPKGARSKTKLEAEAAARKIVDDPAYRKTLIARARACELPPAVETMLWYYAHGKPVERFDHGGSALDRIAGAIEAAQKKVEGET